MLRHTLIVVAVVWAVSGIASLTWIAWDAHRDQRTRRRLRELAAVFGADEPGWVRDFYALLDLEAEFALPARDPEALA